VITLFWRFTLHALGEAPHLNHCGWFIAAVLLPVMRWHGITIPLGNSYGQYPWVIKFIAGTKKPAHGGLDQLNEVSEASGATPTLQQWTARRAGSEEGACHP
jgi:hypothetical protein